ncbi:MAG: hypothetical protein IJ647_10260 [Prevotella sp.]|nr:hypothetical protein [Prevotella sp.]
MNNNALIWVACSKGGQYVVFKAKPNRDTSKQVWCGDYDGKGQLALAHLESLGISLPELTWESEPVQLKISCEVWRDQGL